MLRSVVGGWVRRLARRYFVFANKWMREVERSNDGFSFAVVVVFGTWEDLSTFSWLLLPYSLDAHPVTGPSWCSCDVEAWSARWVKEVCRRRQTTTFMHETILNFTVFMHFIPQLKWKTNTQLYPIINKSRLTSNATLHNNLQEASQLLSPRFSQEAAVAAGMRGTRLRVSHNYTRLA